MRWITLAAAMMLPVQSLAGTMPAGTMVMTVCTARGPVNMTLDEAGRPAVPDRRDAGACAHLWCPARARRAHARPHPGN